MAKLKVLTVVGTRPQYVKAAAVSRILRRAHDEILVDTGQHYDFNMSDVFIRELEIPPPDHNLGVGSAGHAEQTARIMLALEPIVQSARPDAVLVYGDTNSTLAGALVAAKLGVRLAHVEAGLRSFNWAMPEEINRVLTDSAADLLFCPTNSAVDNLRLEGVVEGVHNTGDVMLDTLQRFLPRAEETSRLPGELNVGAGSYILVTLHRPANVDDLQRLAALLDVLARLEERVVFPVHPRTRSSLAEMGYEAASNLTLIDPVGYLDMLWLEKNARRIVTDSGGVQKEAYLLGVPCVTARAETEWTETVDAGWNTLAGDEPERIVEAVLQPVPAGERPPVFGDGHAADRIVELLS
ncbi:MAG: UDP-N-acetylglucosamine 2-epimerase (non-hydrolyzing) [Dehalococcoidia bacterium]